MNFKTLFSKSSFIVTRRVLSPIGYLPWIPFHSRSFCTSLDRQVKLGDIVYFAYETLDEKGELIEYTSADDDGDEFEVGSDVFPKLISENLIGMRKGEVKSLTFPNFEMYGPYDKEDLFLTKWDELPEDVEFEIGEEIEFDTEEDGRVQVRVSEIRDEGVLFDGNHPNAGQKVSMNMKVLGFKK